jgi:hypothetical protein
VCQLLSGYTETINTLDYSAAVFPVTKADQCVDIADPNYKPLNSADQWNWEACEVSFIIHQFAVSDASGALDSANA